MNVVVRKTEPPCKATDLELLGLVEVYSPALMLWQSRTKKEQQKG